MNNIDELEVLLREIVSACKEIYDGLVTYINDVKMEIYNHRQHMKSRFPLLSISNLDIDNNTIIRNGFNWRCTNGDGNQYYMFPLDICVNYAHARNRLKWYLKLGIDVYRREFCDINLPYYDLFAIEYMMLRLGEMMLSSISGVGIRKIGASMKDSGRLIKSTLAVKYIKCPRDHVKSNLSDLYLPIGKILLFNALHLEAAGIWMSKLGIDVYTPDVVNLRVCTYRDYKDIHNNFQHYAQKAFERVKLKLDAASKL